MDGLSAEQLIHLLIQSILAQKLWITLDLKVFVCVLTFSNLMIYYLAIVLVEDKAYSKSFRYVNVVEQHKLDTLILIP